MRTQLSAVGIVALMTPTLWADPARPAPEPFGLTRIHRIHLEFTAREWERMQPTGGFRFPGMAPPARPAEKAPVKPGEEPIETHRSAFGMEFPYGHADFSGNGVTLKNVGVRYKGNGSYMPTLTKLKRNFKIELDHYNDTQRYLGQKSLNLNAGAADPTRGHEVLAYAVFRAAGVPAPRTALAEVTLTVAGKYDKEYLGLYTMVEQVDKTFLSDRFKTAKGMLVKPEGLRGLDFLGDEWEPYRQRYKPKGEPTAKERERLISFVRLVDRGTDEQFQKQIASFLDVDAFFRFMAANAVVANMDSFFTIGHNYYLYLHPETNKFQFLPWDLDLALAGFPLMGNPEQQMDLSLTKPYAGQVKLVDRLLAMPGMSEKYRAIVREVVSKAFNKEQMLKDIAVLESATKEILAKEKQAEAARKEPQGGMMGSAMFARSPDLRVFVEKRSASIDAQLAGKSKGHVPTTGFPFGGQPPGGAGGARPGGGGGMGGAAFLTKPMFDAMDKDKDARLSKDELLAGLKLFFATCDRDKKGAIVEKQLADGINRTFPLPGGFEILEGGFGPGNFMSGPVLNRCDADKDGKITLAEMTKAFEAFFVQADTEKKGSLDDKQLAASFRLLFPPPPGFGQPMPPPMPENRKP